MVQLTEKHFLKGFIIQTETTLSPDEPSKRTCIIETLCPNLDGLFRGHYTTRLATAGKMILQTGAEVLCEISKDEDENLNIDKIYVDVEDL